MREITPSAKNRVLEDFFAKYSDSPTIVARAPGRVNLIGEHTDYNEGFVLPIALPFDTVIAANPVEGSDVTVFSEDFGETTFNLDDDPFDTPSWARYLHGVGVFLRSTGMPVNGWAGCIATDVPIGANLASSAALEVAAGLVYSSLADSEIDLRRIAQCGQYVENHFFGLPSGIMDQLTCALAKPDSALWIDCQDLSTRTVLLPEGLSIVVMDTGTRRELVGTEYANRRSTCERVANALGVRSLRNATLEDLNQLDKSDGSQFKRARHVISENRRTEMAVDALRSNDLVGLGVLMNDSHRSLQLDFEVSSPALDEIVRVAFNSEYCFGARMTGGGFAGCAIAIVETGAVGRFCKEVTSGFRAPQSQPAEIPTRVFPVRASAGASLI